MGRPLAYARGTVPVLRALRFFVVDFHGPEYHSSGSPLEVSLTMTTVRSSSVRCFLARFEHSLTLLSRACCSAPESLARVLVNTFDNSAPGLVLLFFQFLTIPSVSMATLSPGLSGQIPSINEMSASGRPPDL